jgi:hypothetical protein
MWDMGLASPSQLALASDFVPEAKKPERKLGHSTPSSVTVNNVHSFTSSPQKLRDTVLN